MAQTLPKGSFIVPADIKRIEAALEELKKTNGAHASLQVEVKVHVHHEYPKHVQVGGETVLVNSPDEEAVPLEQSKAPKAHSGPKLVEEPQADLTDMSKAERKEELGSLSKAELRDLAEQHDVHTGSSMNKGEITSALNKQLNKEAKTGTK
jgi:hypothetical protein